MVIQCGVGIARVDGRQYGYEHLTGLSGRLKGLVKLHRCAGKVARAVVARCKVGVEAGRHTGVQAGGVVCKALAPHEVALVHIAQDSVACPVGFEIVHPQCVVAPCSVLRSGGEALVALQQFAGAGVHRGQNTMGIRATDQVVAGRKRGDCGPCSMAGLLKVGHQPVGFRIHQSQAGLQLLGSLRRQSRLTG